MDNNSITNIYNAFNTLIEKLETDNLFTNSLTSDDDKIIYFRKKYFYLLKDIKNKVKGSPFDLVNVIIDNIEYNKNLIEKIDKKLTFLNNRINNENLNIQLESFLINKNIVQNKIDRALKNNKMQKKLANNLLDIIDEYKL